MLNPQNMKMGEVQSLLANSDVQEHLGQDYCINSISEIDVIVSKINDAMNPNREKAVSVCPTTRPIDELNR